MVRGIINYFDESTGNEYGFLTVLDAGGEETDEQMFFHLDDGRGVGTNGFDKIFFDGRPDRQLMPRRGMELVFRPAEGSLGRPKARPWAYASEWDSLERIISTPLVREDEDAEVLSTGAVVGRIERWAGGNAGLVREALALYPGDFV